MRAHLASRKKCGKVFRLCTQQYFDNVLSDFSRPAIYRCDLTLLVLRLKALGIKNIWNFRYHLYYSLGTSTSQKRRALSTL
jgi:HrpA-like RNA helicase